MLMIMAIAAMIVATMIDKGIAKMIRGLFAALANHHLGIMVAGWDDGSMVSLVVWIDAYDWLWLVVVNMLFSFRGRRTVWTKTNQNNSGWQWLVQKNWSTKVNWLNTVNSKVMVVGKRSWGIILEMLILSWTIAKANNLNTEEWMGCSTPGWSYGTGPNTWTNLLKLQLIPTGNCRDMWYVFRDTWLLVWIPQICATISKQWSSSSFAIGS